MRLVVAVEIHRRTNIGTALRCAVAFGADAMIIVGSKQFSTHGAHGAQSHIPILHFFQWLEFQEYAKSYDLCIYGLVGNHNSNLESISIDRCIFNKGSAFIVPNRSNCLSDEQITICDALLHVHFPGGEQLSQLVQTDVKLSICLEKFSGDMKFEKVVVEGEKFRLHRFSHTKLHSKTLSTTKSDLHNCGDVYDSLLSLYDDSTI
jgi:hypothetical protein